MMLVCQPLVYDGHTHWALVGPAAPLQDHSGTPQGNSTVFILTEAPKGRREAGGVSGFPLGPFSYLLIQETTFGKFLHSLSRHLLSPAKCQVLRTEQ